MANQVESRRSFLKGVAMTGAFSMVSAGSAEGQTNPVVPNAAGESGSSIAEFQVPHRPMGKTGLNVSILGMGGFHLGTAAGQPRS